VGDNLQDIRADGTATLSLKLRYAMGGAAEGAVGYAFNGFNFLIYTVVFGLPGTLAGAAVFLSIILDAVSDPLIGYLSDRWRSRWGRRHPLLIIGGLPTALLFLALFPPEMGLGQAGLFLWLVIVSIMLRTCLTIYFIPYSAMGAELSADYDERTVIAKARVTMGWFAAMFITAGALTIIFQGDGDSDGRLIASNYSIYGIVSAIIAGITALACIVGTWSVIPRLPETHPRHPGFTLRRTIEDVKSAASNFNFRATIASSLAFGMSVGIYNTLSLYMGTYFWEFTTEQLAAMVFPTFLATLFAFTFINPLGRKFDKPQLMQGATLLLALNSIWMIGARLLGLLPDNGHMSLFIMQLVTTFIGVIMIVALQVVSASLTADILDEQEISTGKRQEGVFFAAGAFIQKATIGLGAFFAGFIIDLAGIEPGSEPGTVDAGVLNNMGWMSMLMTVILLSIAFLSLLRIRLSREDHERIRRQLARA